jgi:uncharacterized protein
VLAIVAILAALALVGPALAAALVLLWARYSDTPWDAIGYGRPRRWIAGLIGGLALGFVLKLVMKAVFMPLLGAPAVNAAYRYLVANPAALPGITLAVIVGAGFGEETVFRGWMFERLGKLFGPGRGATIAIVAITSTLFALAHYGGQGIPGVEQAAVTGIVFGSLYAWTRRLWMVVWAHIAFDLTAVAIIYLGLEEAVAHSVFE